MNVRKKVALEIPIQNAPGQYCATHVSSCALFSKRINLSRKKFLN